RLVLGVHRDVRAHWPRQYRLPSGRLYVAVRARSAPAPDAGFLLSQLLGHDRFGDRAGHAVVHAEHGGVARRLSRRGHARRRRGPHPRGADGATGCPFARAEAASRRGGKAAGGRPATAAVAADPAQPRALFHAVDGWRWAQPIPRSGLGSTAWHAVG